MGGSSTRKGDYLRTLASVLGSIAMHGHAIIIGRGANYLLDPERGLCVRITALLDARIESIARERGVDLVAAEKLVHLTDEDRAAFVQHHFHRDIADPLAYDLVINTGRLGIDPAVDLITRALRQKLAGRPNVQF